MRGAGGTIPIEATLPAGCGWREEGHAVALQTRRWSCTPLGQTPRLERVTIDDPGPGEVRVAWWRRHLPHRSRLCGLCARPHRSCSATKAPGSSRPSARGRDLSGPVGEHVAISWHTPCGACRNCPRGPAGVLRGRCSARPRPRVRLGDTPLAVMLNVGALPLRRRAGSQRRPLRARHAVREGSAARLRRCDGPRRGAAPRQYPRRRRCRDHRLRRRRAQHRPGRTGARRHASSPSIATPTGSHSRRLRRDARHRGDQETIVEQVRALTEGRGVDHAFELVGRTDADRGLASPCWRAAAS